MNNPESHLPSLRTVGLTAVAMLAFAANCEMLSLFLSRTIFRLLLI